MSEIIGYMVTWTTYGTWLQGERKYVKDGQTLPKNTFIHVANLKSLKDEPVILSKTEMETIRKAILDEAELRGHKILAIKIKDKHVHIVAEPCKYAIEEIVSIYKNKAAASVRKFGRPARIWTKGFYKGFCFTKDDILNRINYVVRHKD